MMRSALLLAFAICGAHAIVFPPAFVDTVNMYHNVVDKVPSAKLAVDNFLTQATGRRSDDGLNAENCAQVGSMTADQFKSAMSSSAPTSCFSSMLDLVKTMCTPACLASPMLQDMTSGSRRLLGGVNTNNPSDSCADPCFVPFMQSMIRFMNSAANPDCAAMFPSPAPTPSPGGRRLLGGSVSAEESEKMEMMMGMLCTKNAQGDYCMDKFDALNNMTADGDDARDVACASNCTQTTGASSGSACDKSACPVCDQNVFLPECRTCAVSNGGCGACVDCYIANKDMCQMANNEKAAIEGLGCCFGTMFAMAGLAPDSSTKETDDPAMIANHMASCGVTVSTVPCPMAGMKAKSVQAETKLSGVTVAQFDSAAQTTFKKGMAKTCDVNVQQVIISGFRETTVRRATGLQVDSQVSLTGSQVDTASSIQTKMQDTTTLTSNIQAEDTGTSLASASVASSSATTTETVEADPNIAVGDNSVSSVRMAAQVPLVTLVLCLVAALIRH